MAPRTPPRPRLAAGWLTTSLLAVAVSAAAAVSPNKELAPLLRAGQWQEVRAACSAYPPPWPPEVALAAARAARQLGDPLEAEEILRQALPRAGELAAALRLEGAEGALERGEDPWPWVKPLLGGKGEAAHRHAAARVLRRSWEVLPLSTLAQYRARLLPPALQRWLDAITATRQGNVPLALTVLAQRADDAAAGRVAAFLASRPGLPPGDGLLVGRALLASGMWREASHWLAHFSPTEELGQRYQLAFLKGRTAYRLGRLTEAAAAFEQAIALASTPTERHSAAVQLARCKELAGDWEMAQAAWQVARRADPAAPAGWEGVARASIVAGNAEGVCAALAGAPSAAREVAAERIAALLLARSLRREAHLCLHFVAKDSGRARLLEAVRRRLAGQDLEARQQLVALLADPAAGKWREVALLLLPMSSPPPQPSPAPSRSLVELAELAVSHGPEVARTALAAALALDAPWAPVLQGPPPPPTSLPSQLTALLSAGLEGDAARLFPLAFPVSLPAEAAWSARVLASWGNGPAALRAGERVWQALGRVPAGLLPASVTQAVLPPQLLEPVVAAAGAQVSPALLAAVIRQESRFDAHALSPAGARGLAQIVPETARRLGASEEDLWRPEISLVLAARELARLEKVFGARPAVVAAAYNAGEAVVTSWLATLGESGDEITFIAAIPYRETSEYVQGVLEGMGLARHLEESYR